MDSSFSILFTQSVTIVGRLITLPIAAAHLVATPLNSPARYAKAAQTKSSSALRQLESADFHRAIKSRARVSSAAVGRSNVLRIPNENAPTRHRLSDRERRLKSTQMGFLPRVSIV